MKGRRNMKSSLCIPRLRGINNSKNTRVSPLSLLERFREAVFRLIMLTALSKTTRGCDNGSDHVPRSRPYYHQDQHNSDAVADCIEFIKKSASPEENRDSYASSSMNSDDQNVFPVLSVM
ncbi:hypothetical protein IFM89_001186 [Coptis chinensis]|uniref:Josephin-like protein n=1 Tax=Coptis chinensis TaxID=261450 RepID=A0A835IMT1_9MAGN|nr:hypothetical protein IFM89_001186 [Coptis chinensis]